MVVNLRDIIKENDLMGEILSTHSGIINKAKIDIALVANGYTIPLPNKVSFHMFNGSDMHLVTWFPHIGKYGIEKLTLK